MSSVTLPAGPARAPRAGVSSAQPVRPATLPVFWRRRVLAAVVLALVVWGAAVLVGRIGAQAELADPVAGHVVVEPGQTLWEVAATTAPDGVDPRQQLADLKELNGLTAGDVDAWTVVLLPAR